MHKHTSITDFIKYLGAKYDKKPTWIIAESGLDSSTLRKWKSGTKPSKSSLAEIRKTIEKNMPDELSIYDKLVSSLETSDYSYDFSDNDYISKIRVLDSIIDSRDFSDEEKKIAKEKSAEILVKYDFEFARNFAENVTIDTSVDDHLKDLWETEEDLPKYIKLQPTDVETKTFALIDGFFLDLVRIPGEYGNKVDGYNLFLWHERTPGDKLFVIGINKPDTEKAFGDFMTGVTVIANGSIMAESIHEYCVRFLGMDDDSECDLDCEHCDLHDACDDFDEEK